MSNVTPGLVCGHHHLLLRARPGHAGTAAATDDVPRGARADLVAARRRPRPGDDPVVGDARRGRGAAVGDDGDRRPPRVPVVHRGQPRRARRRLRRGRRAAGHGVRRHRPPRARRGRRGLAENERYLREAGAAWSACTPRSPAPTTRWRPPPASPGDLGVGVHIHVAEGPTTRRRRPPGGAGAGRLAARPLRAPRPPAARHHRPQPAEQHEQRRRLRPPGALANRSSSAPTASAPTCWRRPAWPTSPCGPTT